MGWVRAVTCADYSLVAQITTFFSKTQFNEISWTWIILERGFCSPSPPWWVQCLGGPGPPGDMLALCGVALLEAILGWGGARPRAQWLIPVRSSDWHHHQKEITSPIPSVGSTGMKLFQSFGCIPSARLPDSSFWGERSRAQLTEVLEPVGATIPQHSRGWHSISSSITPLLLWFSITYPLGDVSFHVVTLTLSFLPHSLSHPCFV